MAGDIHPLLADLKPVRQLTRGQQLVVAPGWAAISAARLSMWKLRGGKGRGRALTLVFAEELSSFSPGRAQSKKRTRDTVVSVGRSLDLPCQGRVRDFHPIISRGVPFRDFFGLTLYAAGSHEAQLAQLTQLPGTYLCYDEFNP